MKKRIDLVYVVWAVVWFFRWWWFVLFCFGIDKRECREVVKFSLQLF